MLRIELVIVPKLGRYGRLSGKLRRGEDGPDTMLIHRRPDGGLAWGEDPRTVAFIAMATSYPKRKTAYCVKGDS